VWLGAASGDLALPSELLKATTSLVVATGIVNVWTEPSAKTIEAYHRVSAEAPGRILLGIGSGHGPMVERMTDQKYVRPLTKLLAYADDLDAATPPVPKSERVFAALGPRTLAASAERAAGAHPYLTTPEHTRSAREILGDGPLLAPDQKIVLDTDPVRARETIRATMSLYFQLPNYMNNLRRLGFTDEDLTAPGSDRLVDALVAWGDVGTVLKRVEEHLAAGADHVCIQVLGGGKGLPLEGWREVAAALSGSAGPT
jgi:probable F420-dependent oxidoreductase